MATRILCLIAFLLAVVLAPISAVSPALAQDDFAAQVNALGPGSFSDREKAMNALVATGDERVPPILQGHSIVWWSYAAAIGLLTLGAMAAGISSSVPLMPGAL
jgi:urea transport system permease protein